MRALLILQTSDLIFENHKLLCVETGIQRDFNSQIWDSVIKVFYDYHCRERFIKNGFFFMFKHMQVSKNLRL